MLPVIALLALGTGLLALRGRPTAAAAPAGASPDSTPENPIAGAKTYLHEWLKANGYALIGTPQGTSPEATAAVAQFLALAEQRRALMNMEAVFFTMHGAGKMLGAIVFSPPINGKGNELYALLPTA
jgi:hypothetical protein